jgi:hypothetical protein
MLGSRARLMSMLERAIALRQGRRRHRHAEYDQTSSAGHGPSVVATSAFPAIGFPRAQGGRKRGARGAQEGDRGPLPRNPPRANMAATIGEGVAAR